MQQIYKRTPILKCDFSKVASYKFTEISLQRGCSPVNLLNIFGILLLKAILHGKIWMTLIRF